MTDIALNLADVRAKIAAAARADNRSEADITLVAVSKSHATETIVPALEAGHRVFGENRVQEAIDKWPELKDRYPDTHLHLIGPLQRNKARRAVELFDTIETLDRRKLATQLARVMDETGRRPDCLIQINTGEEDQKASVLPADADAFIEACRKDLELPITGLMCIPPVDDEPSLHFALLRKIARRHGLARLSMGMSADYETAIRFGATSVRVGTAIFGERPPYRPST